MLNIRKAWFLWSFHVFLKVLRHPRIFLLSVLLIIFNCALVFSSEIIPICVSHIILHSWIVSCLRTIGFIWMMPIPRLLNWSMQKTVMLLGLSSSINCSRCSIRISNFITSKSHHSFFLSQIPMLFPLFNLFIRNWIIKFTSRSSSFSKNFNYLLK